MSLEIIENGNTPVPLFLALLYNNFLQDKQSMLDGSLLRHKI